jgi:PKD-like domain
MKTKQLFSRGLLLIILLLSSWGAFAQTSTTLTQNVCPGTEPYLVVPGNAANTFQWNISTGTSGLDWTISTPTLSGTNVIWANPLVPTTYELSLSESDGTLCATLVSVSVTVYPLPLAYAVTGGGSYCIGGTGLPVGLSNSQTSVNYQLQLDGVNSGASVPGTGAALNFGNKTVAGTYTVIATNALGSGCTLTMTGNAVVVVNPLPTPTITGSITATTLTSKVYTTEAGMTGYAWTVSAGGTITAGAGTNAITVTWNTAGPQTVSVNYSNANTCTAASATVYNVTVSDQPTIDGPTPVCVNSTTSVYTTEAGMTAYTWTVSAGGTITAGAGTNAITVTWNTVGPQTITVNYTNGSGYTAPSPTSYPVTVVSLPVPTLAGPSLVCVNTSGNVYTTESGMTGYTWVVSAGGTITSGGTGTSNTATVTWNTAGPQTVSVNYANATGCLASSPTVNPVTVNALPTTSPIWHN